jgi:hypothetical protein
VQLYNYHSEPTIGGINGTLKKMLEEDPTFGECFNKRNPLLFDNGFTSLFDLTKS